MAGSLFQFIIDYFLYFMHFFNFSIQPDENHKIQVQFLYHPKLIFPHSCIRVNKMKNDRISRLSQFIPLEVKRILVESQPRVREKLRKLRLRQ